jgi:hypothetical protein
MGLSITKEISEPKFECGKLMRRLCGCCFLNKKDQESSKDPNDYSDGESDTEFETPFAELNQKEK